MNPDCIFCKIANKEIPAEIIYEDDSVIAFPDINPVAKIHTIIIPKDHIESVNELNLESISIIGKLFLAAQKIAKNQNIADSGYRLTTNTGPDAGQSVSHLHFHLLGGEKLGPIA